MWGLSVEPCEPFFQSNKLYTPTSACFIIIFKLSSYVCVTPNHWKTTEWQSFTDSQAISEKEFKIYFI